MKRGACGQSGQQSADLCRTVTQRPTQGEFQTSIPQSERITVQYSNYPAAVQWQAASIQVRNQISFHLSKPDPPQQDPAQKQNQSLRGEEQTCWSFNNQPENSLQKLAAHASPPFTSAHTSKSNSGSIKSQFCHIFFVKRWFQRRLNGCCFSRIGNQSGSDELLAVINQQICKPAD